MHGVLQVIETAVVAMAATAFAHFGVTLKAAPCPKAEPAVQRLQVATIPAPVQALPRRRTPCSLGERARPV